MTILRQSRDSGALVLGRGTALVTAVAFSIAVLAGGASACTAGALVSVTPVATPVAMPTPVPVPTEKYQTPGDYAEFITVDGFERWFLVHIPPGYQPGVQMPLVVNLHGAGGDAFSQQKVSGVNAKADEAGFIAVHPQAMGEKPIWYGPFPGLPGQPDRDFFRELLAHLQREISIDPARIYATGISNGGTMANGLGCYMSETFAAIAPVSGGHTAFWECEMSRPVSVLVIHGTSDQVIPYHGRGDEVPPVREWVEAWAERNGCDAEPVVAYPYTDKVETWEHCDAGVVVALHTREGGGHVWPGSELGEMLEGASSTMDATDVIWAFFEAHPRP